MHYASYKGNAKIVSMILQCERFTEFNAKEKKVSNLWYCSMCSVANISNLTVPQRFLGASLFSLHFASPTLFLLGYDIGLLHAYMFMNLNFGRS